MVNDFEELFCTFHIHLKITVAAAGGNNVGDFPQNVIQKEDEYSIRYCNACGVAQVMDKGNNDVMDVVGKATQWKENAIGVESPPP